MRSGILSESTHCPAEKAVLLASFGVQAKYGNYEKEVNFVEEFCEFCQISYVRFTEQATLAQTTFFHL